MTKPQSRKERIDILTERAIKFFDFYGDELESISQILKIRLSGLASAYSVENNLPRESVKVNSRVKSLPSFLRKLDKLNWPMYDHPTDVVSDLIGARVVCWFVDDCYGILDFIRATKQFLIRPLSLEDYIDDPKSTGYRAIHILADVSYDRVKTYKKRRTVIADRRICEIQIRTKFQDAWADFTHDLHTKIPASYQADLKTAISDIANRLATEDRSALVVRNLLQKQEDKKDSEDPGND